MTQKIKILTGAAALALLIGGAAVAYNALRGTVEPEIMLAEQPGILSAQQDESGAADEAAQSDSNKIKAPDFEVEDSDGNTVKLSDLKGTPVVLNFWASWCPPCKAEMPDFDHIYAEVDGGVAFMMVNLTDGQRETKEKADEYVAEQGFSFPIYYDTKQEAAYAYSIRSIPTTLFIDRDGYVVTGAEGQISSDALEYGISLINIENNAEGEMVAAYRKITATEAHDMMNAADSFVLLDVRTDEEYREKHIPGAVLIPDTELAARAEAELPDKSALVFVYCRSGNRSADAAHALIDLGYTNVYDFGGIIDWSYDTE